MLFWISDSSLDEANCKDLVPSELMGGPARRSFWQFSNLPNTSSAHSHASFNASPLPFSLPFFLNYLNLSMNFQGKGF